MEAPKPTDALQGFIGDCYYLSALSALARADAGRLRELIQPTAGGAFTARFFRREADGALRRESVTIDAQVPVRVSDGRPIYARARARSDGRTEAWPLLLEKAYAAWKGGYDVMGEGGLVEETLEELTGQRTKMLLVAETRPEELWHLLERATREGWPTVVCTQGRHERPGVDDLGFHPNHIVIFLGVHTWMGRRIVWLRDPFDVPATGSLVRPDPHGVYTVSWDEFLAYFAEVEINSPDALGLEMSPHPSVPIHESLDRSYAFAAVGPAHRRRMARSFVRRLAQPGEEIARAGTVPDRLHLIEHGRAAVVLPSRRGVAKRITVLSAGDTFGEMHVLDGRPFDASLVALTPVAHYSVSRDRLAEWVAEHPEIDARLRRRWDLRITMLDWSARQLTTVDADALLGSGIELVLRKGEHVYRPGDASRFVYLVVEGTVEMAGKKPGGRGSIRARLRAGEVFGEIEVLRGRPRTASARAASRAKVLQIDLGESASHMDRFDVVQRQLAGLAERHERMIKRVARHTEHALHAKR